MKLRTSMLAAALACGSLAITGAQAEGNDLKSLERALDTRYHLHPEKIPMMGFMGSFTNITTKRGVCGMSVVTYENLPEGLDREAVTKLIRTHLSHGWSLMVRDHDGKDNGSDDMVWVQPAGERMRMLVVNMEPDEIDLVQMDLSPDELKKWTAEHGG